MIERNILIRFLLAQTIFIRYQYLNVPRVMYFHASDLPEKTGRTNRDDPTNVCCLISLYFILVSIRETFGCISGEEKWKKWERNERKEKGKQRSKQGFCFSVKREPPFPLDSVSTISVNKIYRACRTLILCLEHQRSRKPQKLQHFREFCFVIHYEVLSATPKNFAIQFAPNNENKTNETAPQGIRRTTSLTKFVCLFITLLVVFTLSYFIKIP